MKKIRDIIIIFLSTIILLEITIQLSYYIQNGSLLFYRVNTPIYVKDHDYGHRVKPFLKYRHRTNEFNVIYYTDSKGFRCSNKFEEYDHPENKYSIVLNGPSFAFGWGVNYEQSFAALLERSLQADTILDKRSIQVINFGVPCRSVPVQIRFFTNEGRHFKPSLVLQFAYGSMIVGDDDPSNYFDVKNGYLIYERVGYQYLISRLKQSGIVFYSWIAYNKLLSLFNDNNHGKKIIGAGRDLANFTKFNVDNIEVKNSLKYYSDLKSYCQSINANLIIIYFPLSYVVYNGDVARWKHLGVENIRGQISFNEQFCNYLNQHGIVCLNLTDGLINAARTSHQRLYYWLDVHWTPYGNKIAAGLVSKFILSHKNDYFKNY